MKTKLDTVYYEIQSDTAGLDAGVRRSEQKLAAFTKHGVRVPLDADGRALDAALGRAQTELSATDRAVQQLTGGFKGLTLAAAAYKAAQYAKEGIELADTYATLEARLGLVTHGTADLAHVQKELFDIAQDAQQPLTSTSDLYTRVARSGEELGASQADLIKFTDGVANSLRVSNTAAAQADGSLLQLSQALGGGIVHAEEFNSILEGTPRIAKAAADGFGATGISVSQLRSLVIAGKVTSKEFFDAFLKGSENVKKEAATMPQTVGGAITKFNNALLQYIGVANKASGTTGEIAQAINVLSENLDNLVQVGAAVGVLFGARFLSGGATNIAAVANEQLKLRVASIAAAQATAQAATVGAAYAEDALRSAAASKAVAEQELLQAAARLEEVAATKAAITAERELVATRLNAMNATGARAAGQLAQPGLKVLGGAAVAREQEALNKAEEVRIANTRELARLGVIQAAQAEREIVELQAAGAARGQLATAIKVEGEALKVVGATGAAVAVAEKEVAVATSLMGTAMKGATAIGRTMWAAIGGPIGAIVLGLYAVYSIMKKIEADALAKSEARLASVQKEVDKYAKSLDKLTVAQLKTAEAAERATLAQKGQIAADLSQKIAAFRDTGADRNEETGGPAKLKKMYDELNAAVDDVLISQGRVGATVAAQEPAATRALGSITDKGAKAAEKFNELIRNTQQFADSLGDVKNPLQDVNDKIADFTHDANEYIATLKGIKKAAAIEKRDTILDQLAAGAAKVAAVNIKSINEDIDALTASLSKNATDVVLETTRKQVQAIKDKAAATRELAAAAKDPGVQQTLEAEAKKLDELVSRYQAAGDAQAEFTDKQTQYEAALQTLIEAQQAADASYQGMVPTLDQLKAANETLAAAELYLKARYEDTTLSLDEHNKAAADLIRIRQALNGMPLPQNVPVSDTNLMAAGLLTASNAAAELAQNLGESGGNLNKLASAGIKLAGILKSVSVLKEVNASDSTASAATRLGAKTDTVALIVGGVIELANAADLFGSKAKKRNDELRAEAKAFDETMQSFAKSARDVGLSSFQASANKVGDDIEAQTKAVVENAGVPGSKPLRSADEIKKRIAELETQIAAIVEVEGETSQSTIALRKELRGMNDTLENATKLEAELNKTRLEAMQTAKDDLALRRLAATGDSEAFAARTLEIDQQRELNKAREDFAGLDGLDAYIADLKDVQALEKQRADTLRAQANAARALDDEVKAFGLTGRDALGAVVASLSGQFGDIKDAVEGLDLSTQEGLDALKKRGQELFAQFDADGVITDDEQQILDALFRIFDNASDVFDSLAERVQRALSKLEDDNAILGGNANEQFGRTTVAARGLSAELDAILASVDVSTGAGADRLKKQLQGLYISLAADELTADETAIVSVIKELLTSLSAVVEDAQQNAAQIVANGVNVRAANRARGERLNAVTDAEGVQAFSNFLTTLAPAVSNLFGEFDVRSIAGITAAKERLVELNSSIDSLSDDQITAQFGLTRDELVDAILKLDSSFDSLASSAKAAADDVTNLANRQREFSASNEDEFLRASGRDQEADINAVKARTEQKLQTAKEVGASQAEIDKVNATGALQIQNIVRQYAEQAAAVVSQNSASVSTSPSIADQQRDFSATSVTSMTSVQGLRLIDVSMSQLALLRDIYGALLSRPMPTPLTPALPQGVGGFSRSNTTGNGGINITINLTGPITGQTAADAAKQLANELLPHIDRGLSRSSASAATRTGNVR